MRIFEEKTYQAGANTPKKARNTRGSSKKRPTNTHTHTQKNKKHKRVFEEKT